MSDVVWVNGIGYVCGLSAADPAAILPESLEDQLASTLMRLDALLSAHALTPTHIVTLRLHLTQFQRFHKRAERRLQRYFADEIPAATSWIGVTDLPRDALIAVDAIIALDVSA